MGENTFAPDAAIRVSPSEIEGPFDWVLVATKVQDTAAARPWLEICADPSTFVAVLQNGIDHAQRLEGAVAAERVLPALVHISAEAVEPGHIRHHTGQTMVVPEGEPGTGFAALFAGSPAAIELTGDFLTAAWRKLFGNIAVAPITALTLARIGIIRHPDIRDLAAGLLREAVGVGRAAGAKLAQDDVAATLAAFERFNPSGGSSMLYDRLAGRRMEHEHLTGALVATADRLGIAVPLNRAVLALLHGIDDAPAFAPPAG